MEQNLEIFERFNACVINHIVVFIAQLSISMFLNVIIITMLNTWYWSNTNANLIYRMNFPAATFLVLMVTTCVMSHFHTGQAQMGRSFYLYLIEHSQNWFTYISGRWLRYDLYLTKDNDRFYFRTWGNDEFITEKHGTKRPLR